MRRIDRLACYAAVLLIVWVTLLITEFSQSTHTFILWAPVLVVLAYGAYLFIWLFAGVASFKTVPEEAESLKLDIQRAKAELSKRGFVI